jgi:hypothetical protein
MFSRGCEGMRTFVCVCVCVRERERERGDWRLGRGGVSGNL